MNSEARKSDPEHSRKITPNSNVKTQRKIVITTTVV